MRMNHRYKSAGKALCLLMLAALFCLAAGCGQQGGSEQTAGDRDTLYQVSLLQGLTMGDYSGSVTAADLKEHGDTGIGTFDGVNGELIMLDGTVYRAAGDGSVEEVPDQETIPFANVTYFDADDSASVSGIDGFQDLTAYLDEQLSTQGANHFQVVKLTGTFSRMYVRSELAQDEPYHTLKEVLETDQRFFDYSSVTGTAVGIYCPVYMGQLNSPGWHFHFLSDDRTMGGHVVDLTLEEGQVQWDETTALEMVLPDSERFMTYDFSTDQSQDVKDVERPTSAE